MAVALAINVSAGKIPKMNIIALKDSKALIAVEQATPESSVLSVESKDGYIVYYKETRKESIDFKTIFDLSEFKDGLYTVKVKTGSTLLKRDFNIKNGLISVEPLKTEFDPVFAMKNNTLRISYLNFDQKDYRFLVYQDGILIHDSELGSDFDLQKKFDFSWLQRGKYDVTLSTTGKEYWYSVKK